MKKIEYNGTYSSINVCYELYATCIAGKRRTNLRSASHAGMAGKAKYQSVVPLQVTVKNNGADFSGDMAINASSSFEAASALVLPLDIAAGEEKNN